MANQQYINDNVTIAQANRAASRHVDNSVGVSIDVISSFIDVSTQVVEDLTRQGILIRLAQGRYDLERSIRRYCTYLRDRKVDRTVVGGSSEVMLLKSITRKLKELEYEKIRGNLILRSLVENLQLQNAQACRALILSLPVRIRQILGLSLDDEQKIETICDFALKEFKEQALELDGGTPGTGVSVDSMELLDGIPLTAAGKPDKRFKKAKWGGLGEKAGPNVSAVF